MIGSDEVDQLLTHGEDEKLDWKKSLKITPDEARAELIRDMISLVNSHGDRRGYLLIGIDNSKNAHDIAGLGLRDEILQESVGALVEPPIRFRYAEIEYSGKKIGCIEIDPSKVRPHVVKKALGSHLQAGDTWIRYGSSKRRPTAWDHEEFCRSRASLHTRAPELSLTFSDESLATAASHNWTRASQHEAKYMKDLRDMSPLPLVLHVSLAVVFHNTGTAMADDVRCVVHIPDGVHIAEGSSGASHEMLYEVNGGESQFELRVKALMHHKPFATHKVGSLIIRRPGLHEFRYVLYDSALPEPVNGVMVLPVPELGKSV